MDALAASFYLEQDQATCLAACVFCGLAEENQWTEVAKVADGMGDLFVPLAPSEEEDADLPGPLRDVLAALWAAAQEQLFVTLRPEQSTGATLMEVWPSFDQEPNPVHMFACAPDVCGVRLRVDFTAFAAAGRPLPPATLFTPAILTWCIETMDAWTARWTLTVHRPLVVSRHLLRFGFEGGEGPALRDLLSDTVLLALVIQELFRHGQPAYCALPALPCFVSGRLYDTVVMEVAVSHRYRYSLMVTLPGGPGSAAVKRHLLDTLREGAPPLTVKGGASAAGAGGNLELALRTREEEEEVDGGGPPTDWDALAIAITKNVGTLTVSVQANIPPEEEPLAAADKPRWPRARNSAVALAAKVLCCLLPGILVGSGMRIPAAAYALGLPATAVARPPEAPQPFAPVIGSALRLLCAAADHLIKIKKLRRCVPHPADSARLASIAALHARRVYGPVAAAAPKRPNCPRPPPGPRPATGV